MTVRHQVGSWISEIPRWVCLVHSKHIKASSLGETLGRNKHVAGKKRVPRTDPGMRTLG
jgi:hypothetical protein